MNDWTNLWNPAVLLGSAGVIGVIASHWTSSRHGLTAFCLIAVLLAGLCRTATSADAVQRGVFALSIGWGLLWVIAHGTVAGSTATLNRQRVEPLPLTLLLLSGLCLTAQAGDVITLFLGLLLTSFGVCVLNHHDPAETCGEQHAIERLWNKSSMCSAQWNRAPRIPRTEFLLFSMLLLGFVLLAAVVGSTRIETIGESLLTSYVNRDAARYAIAGGGSRMLTLSIALVGTSLAGLAFAAPFHLRVLNSLNGRSLEFLPATLLLPRAAVLLVWLKLWPTTLTASESTAQLLVGVLAGMTFVVPLLSARLEQNVARQWLLLAVSQGGWLLMAVAAWSFGAKPIEPSEAWPVVEWNLPNAAQSVWLWLLLDGIAVIGLFGTLAYLVRRERPAPLLDDLRGLLHSEPIAAICATVGLLSLVGTPLLAGFWSRLFVALSAMNVRGEWGPPHLLVQHVGLLMLTIVAVISSAWSMSIALRSIWPMLFGLPLGQLRPAGSISSLFVAILAALVLLGCGLLPGPLLSWLCEPSATTAVISENVEHVSNVPE